MPTMPTMPSLPERAPWDKQKIILLILSVGLLIETVILGVIGINFAKVSRKANLNDEQIKTEVAKQVEEKEKAFNERVDTEVESRLNEKRTRKYTARDFYGAFTFNFPGLYYVYVNDSQQETDQLRIFIDPEFITQRQNQNLYSFMRVVIRNRSYDDVLSEVQNQNTRAFDKMKEEDTIVSGISGKKFTGKLDPTLDPQSIYIVLPYRDKTIFIITDDYKAKLPNGKTREAYFNELLPSFDLRK